MSTMQRVARVHLHLPRLVSEGKRESGSEWLTPMADEAVRGGAVLVTVSYAPHGHSFPDTSRGTPPCRTDDLGNPVCSAAVNGPCVEDARSVIVVSAEPEPATPTIAFTDEPVTTCSTTIIINSMQP